MTNNYHKRKADFYPFKLIGLSALSGGIIGAFITLYMYVVHLVEPIYKGAAALMQDKPLFIPLVLLAFLAVGVAVILLSRICKPVRGGGVPQAEGLMRGILSIKWYVAIPVVFVCSVLAISCGVALGAEGPSILLGCLLASMVARVCKRRFFTERYLVTGGGAAGIAAAFNIPFSGVMLALEEGQKRFSPLILLSTVCQVAVASTVSHLLSDSDPLLPLTDFIVDVSVSTTLTLFLFGIVVAFIAKFYCAYFLKLKDFFKSSKLFKNDAAMLIPFILAVPVLLFFPDAAGSGAATIINVENGVYALSALAILFVLRLVFTVTSSASDLVGGVFVPTLALGAVLGSFLFKAAKPLLPSDLHETAFILSGMAVFFTVISGAPLTSVIMSVELTGAYSSFLPVVCAVVGAMTVTEITRHRPLYDMLLRGIRKEHCIGELPYELEFVIEEKAFADGCSIRDIMFPGNSLVERIMRNGKLLTPDKETVLHAGDKVTVSVDTNDFCQTREDLLSLFYIKKKKVKKEREKK